MKIHSRDGLLFVSFSIHHNGRICTLDNVIVDTGAVQSLIDTKALDELNINPEGEDKLVVMQGIGGADYAVRKRVDLIQFDTFTVNSTLIDFGDLDTHHHGISGLLGTDILVPGHFIIDLDAMEIYQKAN